MIDPPDREIAIFSAARLLPPRERAAYLDAACAGEGLLRQRVEELLQAGEEAGAFLDQPAPGSRRPGEEERPLDPNQMMSTATVRSDQTGDRIGRYKLLQQLGEGGCGVVYMAEQQEPVRRMVALKVIRLGMDTKSVIARFDAERQALAMMDHPNIAKVLEAGSTDAGRPYFVMELVRGIKITDFCDQNNLPTRERLALFVQVCQAIQHAHQKGIIHRDIKPSNILVTLRDGVPVPKIIDFGIAKATTNQRLTDKTLFTAFEQFIGTPAYMSPEQAEMSELGIDTRSDIYSLGVLLYELLTGQTPFDSKELLQAGLDAMRRMIREKEPARPSTRLSTLLETERTRVANHRQTDGLRLVNLLRGDLDWIVVKSLEKDRSRRYETANGLGMDIQRYLNDEPVVARPPSNFYRFQKLFRRHKVLFAALGAVAVALLIGLAVSTSLFLRERATKHALETEAGKGQQAYAFLEEMLQGAGPEAARGRDTTIVLEILANTARDLDVKLKGQPEVQARLSATIGRVYDNLGDFRQAEGQFRKALRLEQSVSIRNDPAIPAYLDALGLALLHANDFQGAAQSLQEALERMKRLPGQTPAAVAQSLNNLGLARWKSIDLTGAQGAFKESLGLLQNLPADNELKVDMAYVLGNLGLVQWEAGDLAGAETSANHALALRKDVDGAEETPDAQALLNNLALVLRDRGDLAGAEAALRRAITNLSSFKLNPDHPSVVSVRNNLAQTLRRKAAVSGDIATFREDFLLNPGDTFVPGALACLLAAPSLKEVLSGSTAALSPWRFTAVQPGANWADPGFVDSAWQSAPAPTGWPVTIHRSETSIITRTNLWLRREFELTELPVEALAFRINRNQDTQIFLNGVAATPILDWTDVESLAACSEPARLALKKGRNVLALHCEEADGGVPIDVAIFANSDATLGKGLVIAEFEDPLTRTPGRAELYAARASVFARMGKWTEARKDLAKAIDLKPKAYGNWCRVAPLLVETGDLPAYQELRKSALRSFAKPDGANGAEHIAKLALLMPLDNTGLEVAGGMADAAAAAEYPDANLAWRQFVKGLAEYRRGHFANAIEWQQKVILANEKQALPGWTREAERNRSAAAYFVLAMAQQKSSQIPEAKSALAKGSEVVRTKLAPLASGDVGREWPDWLIAQILAREASGLIQRGASAN